MAEEAGINAINTLIGATRNNQAANPLEQKDQNEQDNQVARREERTNNRAKAEQDRVNITREARQQNIERTPPADRDAADRGREIERQQDPRSAENQRPQRPRPGDAERQGSLRPENRKQNQPDRAENRNENNPVRQNENPLNRRIQDIGTNQSPRVRNEERQFQPDQNAISQRNQSRDTQSRQEEVEQLRARENSAQGLEVGSQGQINISRQQNQPEEAPDPEEPNLQEVIQESVQRGLGAEKDDVPIDRGPTVEDTQANVQRTRAALEAREARQVARETPVLESPPQDIDRLTINSPGSRNPPTPGLEGSISQVAEKASEEVRVEEARAAALREARKQEIENATAQSDREANTVQNRDPAASQTQVGGNVDRLV